MSSDLKQRIPVEDKAISLSEPFTPTAERLSKSVFTRKSPFRVISTVEALFNAGAIQDAEVQASCRLRRDWLYARYGYSENQESPVRSTHLVHNVLSWRMTRAQVGLALTELRHAVKAPIFNLLELMLIDELSFSGMARVLMPQRSDNAVRNKVSAQCALALSTLAAVYEDMDRARKMDAAFRHSTKAPIPPRRTPHVTHK